MAHRVDLVGRDVQLVVAAVLEQEVVALDASDGALDHAAEPRNPVHVVHDVVAFVRLGRESGTLDLLRELKVLDRALAATPPRA